MFSIYTRHRTQGTVKYTASGDVKAAVGDKRITEQELLNFSMDSLIANTSCFTLCIAQYNI